jgi:small subunit ribosomal protein S19
MSRSRWKHFFVESSVLKKNILKKIWSRNSVITDFFVNKRVLIHSGKEFKSILISQDKVGLKFGEFVYTRKKKSTNKKNLKKKKKN